MRGALVVACASSLLACSLITSLDGYSAPSGQSPSSAPIDAAGQDDASTTDGPTAKTAVPLHHYLFVVGGLDLAQATQRDTFFALVGEGGTLGEWQAGPLLPDPRAQGGLASDGNSLFYIDGMDATGGYTTTVFRSRFHDGVFDAWTTANPTPKSQARISAYELGGGVFAIGGYPVVPQVYRAEVGDLLSAWSAVPSVPDGIANAALTVSGNTVYIVGGQHADPDAGAAQQVYIGHTDSTGTVAAWQSGTPFPVPVSAGAAASTASHLYFNGGYVRDARPVYIAPILGGGAIGEWVLSSPTNHQRAGHGLLVAEDHLYAIAGQENASIADVEACDILAGGALSAFRYDRPLPVVRSYFASIVLTGK